MVLGVISSDAQALALGRVTVLSALGEPLRADIDIPEINADEAASLRVNVASPEAFRAAGLEFSPALSNVTITLQRRPDGRYFLRLNSDKPVNDPFVDLILETSWASGRIVRDYTMLFDPPSIRPAAPVFAQTAPAPAPAPSVTPVRPAAPPTPSAVAPAPAARPGAASRATETSGEGKRVTVRPGDTAGKIAAANKPASVSLDQMLVALLRSNPDAFMGGNVNRLRSGAVLDVPGAEQAGLVPTDEAHRTVVAQSRDFNEFRRRLAEGVATAKVPGSERVVTGKVRAQVEEKKPSAATPDRLQLSKGAVQGKASPDKIAQQRAAQDAATRVAELNRNLSELNKLSSGTAAKPGGTASAAKPGIALPAGVASAAKPAAAASAAKPSAAASTPAQKPASAPAPAAVAAPAAKASAPTLAAAATAPAVKASAPAPTPAPTPAPAPAATPAATPASAATAPAAPAASAPASAAAAAPATAAAPVKPKPAAPKAPPPPPPEPSLIDDLMENPLIPGVVLAALAVLLGVGVYRVRQRRKAAQVDSSFLESRLQPDSFFGASGGQRIDTAESSGNAATGSSMVYSPSQLDAAGDVDPVAEADVYLAYGRDLQAEEILKEALRTNPQRVQIHSKLLEIYAKRRDAKAFEVVATEAYNLTHGDGPEWEHICDMGRELDAGNPMYRPGGQPGAGAIAAAAAASTAAGNFGATTVTPAVPAPTAAAPVDLDLDLDFSLGDEPPAAAPVAAAPAPVAASRAEEKTVSFEAPTPPALDLDFGQATQAISPPAQVPALDLPVTEEPQAVTLSAPDLTLSENSLNFTPEPPPAPAAAKAAPAPAPTEAPAADPGMIEFDLGSLSLDLPGSPAAAPKAAAPSEPDTADAPLSTGAAELSGGDESPLATKLALAEEFNAIGDADGARSLAEEVLAEASGDLKSRAQRLLAEIG